MRTDPSTMAATPSGEVPLLPNADAVYRQGLAFYEGNGVEKDYMRAAFRFHEAAEAGHPEANAQVGRCWIRGIGFSVDLDQGIRRLRTAAEAGVALAQLELASCYEQGRGVEQDQATAVEWYRLAADQGNADALLAMGLALHRGAGIECDIEQAVSLWRRAAEIGSDRAAFNLAILREKSGDWHGALAWYRLAGERGYVPAQLAVVEILNMELDTVPADPVEAAKWTQLAAESGNADAQYQLALNYFYGSGVEPNQAMADQWAVLAGLSGNAVAMEAMGVTSLNEVHQEAHQRFRDQAERYVTENATVKMFSIDRLHVLIDYAQFSESIRDAVDEPSGTEDTAVPYVTSSRKLPGEDDEQPVYVVYTNPDWVPAEMPCMEIRTCDLVDRFFAEGEARGVWVNPWQHDLSFELNHGNMSLLNDVVDRAADPVPMAIKVKPVA